MDKNKKLRLVITAKCHNKCPLCCNNRFDLTQLPVVEHWDYDQIMITGGEPMLFPRQVLDIVKSIRSLDLLTGRTRKIYAYTARFSIGELDLLLFHLDGIVATPHTPSDLAHFIAFNRRLFATLPPDHHKSLRLNLFPEIEKLLTPDIDLSLWQIKKMQWIKDCPVPPGEDLRRINTLL